MYRSASSLLYKVSAHTQEVHVCSWLLGEATGRFTMGFTIGDLVGSSRRQLL